METSVQSFSSTNEEVLYWKRLAETYEQEKKEIQKDFDEFSEQSKLLEKELEADLDQSERKIKELALNVSNLQSECENLRRKLEKGNQETGSLHADLEVLKNDKEMLQKYIRELEQKNDDLERHYREIMETASDLQTSLNTHIERSAMLDSELDEKEQLKERIQRLLDENKDLKQELKLRERFHDNEKYLNGHIPKRVEDSNNLLTESETQTTTPSKKEINIDEMHLSSSRLEALKLVGELMKKIGLSRYVCDICGRISCTLCSTSNGPGTNVSSTIATDETRPKSNFSQKYTNFMQSMESKLMRLSRDQAENGRNRRLNRSNGSFTENFGVI